jgi:hypothetical protein
MPDLGDVIDFWEGIGGGYWQYSQETRLQRDSSVTTTVTGISPVWRTRWSKTVTRSVAGGICITLARRVIEGRMIPLDANRLWEHVKACFDIAKLQQATLSNEKDWYTAGGVEGKPCGGLFDRVSDENLVNRIVGSPGLYIYSMFESGLFGSGLFPNSGHAVAFDTRQSEFWFFDANSGLYQHTAASMPSILAFIDLYWAALGYKQEYSGGSRDLYKF